MAQKHAPVSPTEPRIVVIGGGLAGMAAACELLDSGHPVTLIEKRPYLGGRAFSFVDPQTGYQVDNGQHVFLGCCTEYIKFLKRLGSFDKTLLQPRLHIKVVTPSGKVGVLRDSMLPGSLSLLPSFLAYPYLGVMDKLRLLYALIRIKYTRRDSGRLENMTFYDWLKQHGQTDRAIENFWNLIIRPALNDDIKVVSASMGMMVFQEALLKGKNGANVGYFLGGLSEVMGDAARKYILGRGGNLLLGKEVASLLYDDGKVTGVRLVTGEIIEGDVFVSALSFKELLDTLPSDLVEQPFFARFRNLTSSPIVNVHLWYDRPIMEDVFVAFLDSPLQWVFNKSKILGMDNGKGYISISLSGAWEYADLPKEELREKFIAEVQRALPAARGAKVERSLVVKQEQATFRCLPGINAIRPFAETSVPNLLLAGDWTHTGWPSTMEGAVRSGMAAARLIKSRAGQ